MMVVGRGGSTKSANIGEFEIQDLHSGGDSVPDTTTLCPGTVWRSGDQEDQESGAHINFTLSLNASISHIAF